MKELPFTGHQQDTSVVVTINHCYQYCSGKVGGTKESHKGKQKERKKGKKENHPDEDEDHQASGPA